MSKYTINCSWEMFGHVDVEADSLDKAMDKVKDEMKLSDINAEYVSDSFLCCLDDTPTSIQIASGSWTERRCLPSFDLTHGK